MGDPKGNEELQRLRGLLDAEKLQTRNLRLARLRDHAAPSTEKVDEVRLWRMREENKGLRKQLSEQSEKLELWRRLVSQASAPQAPAAVAVALSAPSPPQAAAEDLDGLVQGLRSALRDSQGALRQLREENRRLQGENQRLQNKLVFAEQMERYRGAAQLEEMRGRLALATQRLGRRKMREKKREEAARPLHFF